MTEKARLQPLLMAGALTLLSLPPSVTFLVSPYVNVTEDRAGKTLQNVEVCCLIKD